MPYALKKAATLGVVLSTILWSVMATVLVAPLKASAAGCTSGSLIKGSLSAVYYCGADMKRYVFTNDKAYFTWYSNFSGVMTISDADLASIQIGGNVTYRPGVKMIKIQSDPKVYAISHGGVLRPIGSEAVASALYGSNWNTQIDDISDAFFTNYTVGNAVNSAGDYDKTAEMSGSQTVNQDKNLSSGPGSLSGVSVSLASDSPASATVPKSATGVNFVKFNVSNGTGSAVVVDSVVLHRVGAGASTDFSNVYLYEGNSRLTTGRSVNSSSNDVTFNSLNLALSAGQTRTLWVAATMSSTAGAGNVNAFQVTAVSSGSSSASGLPVTGNNMTLASATVGSVTIAKSGSLTNPKVGQMNVKLAEFQLSAGAAEDLDIKRVTLFQSGNISRSALTNLKLKAAGTEVASAAGLDDRDRVTFVLTGNTLLEKGNTRTYEVWGDVGGGTRSADTIKLYVEEDADVWATGRTFGFGASVTRTAYDGDSCTSTSGDCSYLSLEGGQITITFNGPAATDIATNGKDKEVLNFTLASQSNVEVRNLRLTVSSDGPDYYTGGLWNHSANTANYTDIKVLDVSSGSVIAGPKDLSSSSSGGDANDTSQSLVYTDVFTLNAGQARTFKVTLDVASAAALEGNLSRVSLAAFQSSDIRNLDNSTFVSTSDIVPSSAITGNQMTVRAASLTVSAASTPVAQTFIQGSQNVELAGISLKAGQGSDVKVTSMTVQTLVDANNDTNFGTGCENNADTGSSDKFATDILLTAKLMNGTTQVGDTKSPTSSTASCASVDGGLLQFTNMNLTIPAGQTVTLALVGNLSGSIANLNDTVAFSVANANVTAQDMDGNSVSKSGSAQSASMIISTSGTMTYALAPDDTESEAGFVLAGTTSVVAKYRFTAQTEDLKLTKVRISVPNYGLVRGVSLYDGSNLLAGPITANTSGHADFSNFSFVVPKDSSKNLTVKVELVPASDIQSDGETGYPLTVYLCDGDGVNENSSGCGTADTSTFEVRGTSAGSSTISTSGSTNDLASRQKTYVKTKMTITPVNLSTSTLSSGTQVVSHFMVAADAAEQVSLKKLTFEISMNNVGGTDLSATGTSLSDSNVREYGQGTNYAGQIDFTTCSTATSVVCTVRVVFADEVTIAAGTSKRFELRLNVSGADTSGESISTKLLGDASTTSGELNLGSGPLDPVIGSSGTSANLIWSDNSLIPHTWTLDTNVSVNNANISDDWLNGALIKILPTDTQTLTRT
ncbi:MAG: hypothetical protein QY323_01290 [Patescibacteria group bacterium]|nr:MAG: hypothetical protein QY323_01290 [Patescibacteria group bacterium]